MSEKLYEFLLKLYPDHFRRTYGDEALRLVRDRARGERGFLSGLRLWLDLLLDLAISLPREYSHARTAPIVAAQPLNGESSFQLLAERSLNPVLLGLAVSLTAVLFWACVSVVEHRSATRFPELFSAPLLQRLAQNAPAETQYPSEPAGRSVFAGEYSLCLTAKRNISSNSAQPLLVFHFAQSGASGVARIDGRIVKVFKNEPNLSIRANVLAGDHYFLLHLDRPAETTLISGNVDFEYCQLR